MNMTKNMYPFCPMAQDTFSHGSITTNNSLKDVPQASYILTFSQKLGDFLHTPPFMFW